jgi:hypothetical protein
MADIIDIGAAMSKHTQDVALRDKIIQQQAQQIEDLKGQMAGISAVNDLLKLLLLDLISTQKQAVESGQKNIEQMQSLLHQLPHITK